MTVPRLTRRTALRRLVATAGAGLLLPQPAGPPAQRLADVARPYALAWDQASGLFRRVYR